MFKVSDHGVLPAAFVSGKTGDGGPARWEVVRDQSAVDGFALEQMSRDATGYRFPLAIYQPFTASMPMCKSVQVGCR